MPPHPPSDPPPDPDALGLIPHRHAFADDDEARRHIAAVVALLRRIGR